VNDVGAAIEACIAAGRPRRISVTRFVDHQPSPAMASRVVALVGPGEPAALFRRAGAATVDVPPTGAPSAGQVLDVIRGTACDAVVVLPNAGELRAVVDAAAALACDEGRSVVVLPTRSPVQGLSALAVHDASRRFDDDVAAMSAAAAATRVADVSRAARAAQTSAGACRAGDILGRIDDDVAVIGDDVASVARELLDRLLVGGGELVTLLTGEGAEPGVAETLLDFLAESWPTVEVTAHAGAPRRHLLVIGVE
jgi:dihydroxyacetone kinase-like predicted kinase